ncbi:hypothetical protein BC830DRAFT_1149295 [Chytriomyces sp. MP71]|nr:hypothetical protein BC830DRAFT_1149295 [Chytriomyces sp. MP71]
MTSTDTRAFTSSTCSAFFNRESEAQFACFSTQRRSLARPSQREDAHVSGCEHERSFEETPSLDERISKQIARTFSKSPPPLTPARQTSVESTTVPSVLPLQLPFYTPAEIAALYAVTFGICPQMLWDSTCVFMDFSICHSPIDRTETLWDIGLDCDALMDQYLTFPSPEKRECHTDVLPEINYDDDDHYYPEQEPETPNLRRILNSSAEFSCLNAMQMLESNLEELIDSTSQKCAFEIPIPLNASNPSSSLVELTPPDSRTPSPHHDLYTATVTSESPSPSAFTVASEDFMLESRPPSTLTVASSDSINTVASNTCTNSQSVSASPPAKQSYRPSSAEPAMLPDFSPFETHGTRRVSRRLVPPPAIVAETPKLRKVNNQVVHDDGTCSCGLCGKLYTSRNGLR